MPGAWNNVITFVPYTLAPYAQVSPEVAKPLFLRVGLPVLKSPKVLVKMEIWYQNSLNQKLRDLHFHKPPKLVFPPKTGVTVIMSLVTLT